MDKFLPRLSDQLIETLAVMKSFLYERGFIDRDFALEDWIDPRALIEAYRLGRTRMAKSVSFDLEMHRARADEQAIIANLLQLYVYEFSASLAIDVGDDGRFPWDGLEEYWE